MVITERAPDCVYYDNNNTNASTHEQQNFSCVHSSSSATSSVRVSHSSLPIHLTLPPLMQASHVPFNLSPSLYSSIAAPTTNETMHTTMHL